MTSSGHQLVEEYLRRFDNASVFLTAERRAELRQEIVEHIDAGLEEADALHARAARTVLERLGPAADIVAAELGQKSTGSTPVVRELAPAARTADEPGPGHDASGPPPLDDAMVPAAPRVRTRRARALLVGALAAATVGGLLAFGASTLSGDPGQGGGSVEVPAITSPDSAPPTADVSPGTSFAPSVTPSQAPSSSLGDPSASAS